MEVTPKAQTVELIKQSNNILLLSHIDSDGDAIGSTLALRLVLLKLGKKVEVVAPGDIDEAFSFLSGFDQMKKQLTLSNDLVISLKTEQTGQELKLGWKKFPDTHRIKIVVTPSQGALTDEDVEIEKAQPKFDLVILLDCASLDRTGKIHQDYPDLFYETSTISIDHHVTNNFFAKVNWVDLTATSTAEMLVSLIESLGRDEPLFDGEIATALLAGLISDTGSFQNVSTTPKSLTVAAQLVAGGAEHQKIIERFTAKNLVTLKLWGKALSRIVEDKEHRFLWTYISKADAEEVGTVSSSNGLVDELLKTVSDVDFVMLITEKDDYLNVNLRSINKDYDVAALAKFMGGGGHQVASGFQVEGSLEKKLDAIIAQLKQYQANRSSLGTELSSGKDLDSLKPVD